MSGQKIIDGLNDAIEGRFTTRVVHAKRDLAARLRDSVDRGHPGHAIRLEAAGEIERMQKALEKIKHLVLTNRTHSVLDEVQGVCDAALSFTSGVRKSES